MEAFLSALDITVARTSAGDHYRHYASDGSAADAAASALKPTFPQILLHNIAIVDAARRLTSAGGSAH